MHMYSIIELSAVENHTQVSHAIGIIIYDEFSHYFLAAHVVVTF